MYCPYLQPPTRDSFLLCEVRCRASIDDLYTVSVMPSANVRSADRLEAVSASALSTIVQHGNMDWQQNGLNIAGYVQFADM